jgi:glycosyltransferase involved in cell wall biosynthesis
MREDLVGKGLQPARIEVIPNAVDPVCDAAIQSARRDLRDRLKIGDDEFIFGFVGRLSEEKGLTYLLEALGRHAPAGGRWRLLVVGDGPRRRELEEGAARAGIADRVVFAGFRSGASPWFSAMDAFVLPSLTEGTPMALLEAMAHRVPVIASAVGGVPAVLSDRVNGLLVPPGDAGALSQALCDLASHEELRQTLSRAGHDTVRDRYDVRPWAATIRRVYERVVQDR